MFAVGQVAFEPGEAKNTVRKNAQTIMKKKIHLIQLRRDYDRT